MADLYLSGIVGYDITEQGVVSFLQENNEDSSHNVYINSPGGSVFDGLGVYNILRNSGKEITTVNNGLAASMASIIFLAGDKRVATTGAMYMVHKPSSISFGNADDLKKSAETLDKIQESLASIYKDRAGIDNIDDFINDETWWNVDEMIEKGIAHAEEDQKNNEGETKNMAITEEMKAEMEKLKAENALFQEQKEEAEFKAEMEALKATNAQLSANAGDEKQVADEKVGDEVKNKEQKQERDVIVTKATDVVKVEDEISIPAYMQQDYKY